MTANQLSFNLDLGKARKRKRNAEISFSQSRVTRCYQKNDVRLTSDLCQYSGRAVSGKNWKFPAETTELRQCANVISENGLIFIHRIRVEVSKLTFQSSTDKRCSLISALSTIEGNFPTWCLCQLPTPQYNLQTRIDVMCRSLEGTKKLQLSILVRKIQIWKPVTHETVSATHIRSHS